MDDSVKIELRSTTSDTFKGTHVLQWNARNASYSYLIFNILNSGWEQLESLNYLLFNFNHIGFFVMAFDIEDDSTPIGTFKQPVDELAQLMNCTSDGVLVRSTSIINKQFSDLLT